jgi:hypothetical protein
MRAWLPGLTLVFLAGPAACDSERPDELPEGWAGAQRLTLEQSSCPAGFASLRGNPRLELTKTDEGLRGLYRDAQFRCNDQKVCGYVLESEVATRVLVQPCDMHPDTVTRCSCHYEISFALPARAGRTTLELYRRLDLYGAQGPVAALLIDTERVP